MKIINWSEIDEDNLFICKNSRLKDYLQNKDIHYISNDKKSWVYYNSSELEDALNEWKLLK